MERTMDQDVRPDGGGDPLEVLARKIVGWGLVTPTIRFFFSARRGPVLRAVSRVGIIYLMIAFGAHFGLTVVGRITLLIGRARDLQAWGWATVAAFVTVVGLIAGWESLRRDRRGDGEPEEASVV